MSKAEEAQRLVLIGMLADAGKLEKVKEIAAKITSIADAANSEEDGIGDAALGLAAIDAAIAHGE